MTVGSDLFAVAYLIATFALPFSSDKLIFAGWPQTPELTQRDLTGSDGLALHCVNSNVTGVHFKVKVLHGRFKLICLDFTHEFIQ